MSDRKLAYAQKVLIVYKLLKGETTDAIAAELNRPVDEINSISETHFSIVEVSHYLNNISHQPINGGLYPLMENVLFSWYLDHPDVSNKQLAEKAKVMVDVLNEPVRHSSQNVPTFTASRNWINGFKTRFNIAAPKRKSTSKTNSDAQKTGSSVKGDGEEMYDSSSESLIAEESENFSMVEQWSDEETMENEHKEDPVDDDVASNDEDIEKTIKLKPEVSDVLRVKEKMENVFGPGTIEAQVNQIKVEPDVNQLADLTNIVADNAKDVVDGNLIIESVVSLAGFVGQDIQDTTDDIADDPLALTDSSFENLEIESVVSPAEEGDCVGNVDVDADIAQGSADHFNDIVENQPPTIVSTNDSRKSVVLLARYCNLKIESVVSLAPEGNCVRKVGKTAETVLDLTDDSRDNVADGSVRTTIDLTETDDDVLDETPLVTTQRPRSRKRKQSMNITVESKRSLK